MARTAEHVAIPICARRVPLTGAASACNLCDPQLYERIRERCAGWRRGARRRNFEAGGGGRFSWCVIDRVKTLANGTTASALEEGLAED
jgi:hypothetical protein